MNNTKSQNLTWSNCGSIRGVGFHLERTEGDLVACIAVGRNVDGEFGVARSLYDLGVGGDALDQMVKAEVDTRPDYLAACIAAEQFKRAIDAQGLTTEVRL